MYSAAALIYNEACWFEKTGKAIEKIKNSGLISKRGHREHHPRHEPAHAGVEKDAP
jgi:hypothetical protein